MFELCSENIELSQVKEWMANPLDITQNDFFNFIQQARGSSKILYTRLLEVQAQSLGLDLGELSKEYNKVAICGGPDLLSTTCLPFVSFLEAEVQRELSSKVIPLASLTK